MTLPLYSRRKSRSHSIEGYIYMRAVIPFFLFFLLLASSLVEMELGVGQVTTKHYQASFVGESMQHTESSIPFEKSTVSPMPDISLQRTVTVYSMIGTH